MSDRTKDQSVCECGGLIYDTPHKPGCPLSSKERLTKRDVIERLCMLAKEVGEAHERQLAYDCFCGHPDSYRSDPTGYRFEVLEFMEEAVREKIKRMRQDETTVGVERASALEALALDVLSSEEECANKQRFPNGCGECIYCQAAALMLDRPAVEPALAAPTTDTNAVNAGTGCTSKTTL